RTPSGRAQYVRAGNYLLSGRAVRERLGLPSTWFDVEEREGAVIWFVRGYGHGVGMSQYGAEGMARAGFTHEAILRHYYRGAELTRMYGGGGWGSGAPVLPCGAAIGRVTPWVGPGSRTIHPVQTARMMASMPP